MAAKRWKAIKLQHDGRETRLRDWRDFRGQYTLFRRNVEDWNEGDEQARLLSMLPEAWIMRVTKEEAKRAKSNHAVGMMLPKEYHTNVVAWTRKNVTRDVKRHSLRNDLLITVTGDREKTAMWRLDEYDVGGQTIRLQAIAARISCDEILEWVREEVLKEYWNLHHTRGLRPGDRDVNYVGEGSGGEAAMDPAGADGDVALDDDGDDDEPAEVAVCAFVANNLNTGSNRGSWKPLQKGWKKKEKKDPRRIGEPPLSFGEFIRAHPQGCFVCYGRNKGFNHDHRTCPIHKAKHGRLQEGARVEEACTRGYPGDQGGGHQGQALQADVGGERVGQGDPGDQEVLASQVGRQEQGEQRERQEQGQGQEG